MLSDFSSRSRPPGEMVRRPAPVPRRDARARNGIDVTLALPIARYRYYLRFVLGREPRQRGAQPSKSVTRRSSRRFLVAGVACLLIAAAIGFWLVWLIDRSA